MAIEPFVLEDYDELDRRYWSTATVTVGELMEVDVVNEEWFVDFDSYSDEQAARLWKKFVGRFQFREIGMITPARWKIRLKAKLNEIMPKYKPLYEAIDNGMTTLVDYDEWHKARDVFSSFPQTSLGGSDQDYASSGSDREYETIRDYGLLDVAERLDTYYDVDAMILNELEPLFMVIRSTSIPWM